MNLLLGEDERQIVEQSRAFLAGHCSPALVRRHELEGGFSRELWKNMLELGWLDLSLPEDVGGLGLPLTYSSLIFEELGRAIAPAPLLGAVASALVIASHGGAEQKALIARMREGRSLIALALQGTDGDWKTDASGLEGRMEGGRIVLNGAKSFVDNFEHADHVLVSFKGPDGNALALVETGLKGLSYVNLVPTAKDSQALVSFDDVSVPMSAILAGGEAAIRNAMDLAAMFSASYMSGAARRATELAVDYANNRVAFGQPIGSFQAIQHTCADMIIGVDGAQLLAREAAWRKSSGLDATVQASQAKAFANDKCVFACRSAQQIHGGLGFIMECDVQLWYRRVVANALRFGTALEHRAHVADHLMCLGRKIRSDWSEMPPPAGNLVPSAKRLGLAA